MSRNRTNVCLDFLYRYVWEDGFGARGWKLTRALDDPEVIASTAETGERVPTSVFVHDVLDHALCGLGTSGHRNEAIALMQLASRTGADPTPDFAQMVDEDLLQGVALGESWFSFLPQDLATQVPTQIRGGRDIIGFLVDRMGRQALRNRLIDHFFVVGAAGSRAAGQQYCSTGLEYRERTALGLALQDLLEQADSFVSGLKLPFARGAVCMAKKRCSFTIDAPRQWSKSIPY